MATLDDDRSAELTFERELLASAAADGVPDADVHAAWARFATTLGTTAALAHAMPNVSGAGAKLSARSALGWLSLGAVGGGAAVAAVFGVLTLRDAPSKPAVADASAAPSAAIAANLAPSRPVAVPAPSAAPSSSATETVPPSAQDDRVFAAPSSVKTPNSGRARVGATERRASLVTSDRASALAAEIALLDEARRAASAGDYERALAVLTRYRREHPRGELRRESDVLTMETLSRRGDKAEARRLAREFLSAFPDDPHVSRVREFEE